jgi:hypothetical protein
METWKGLDTLTKNKIKPKTPDIYNSSSSHIPHIIFVYLKKRKQITDS